MITRAGAICPALRDKLSTWGHLSQDGQLPIRIFPLKLALANDRLMAPIEGLEGAKQTGPSGRGTFQGNRPSRLWLHCPPAQPIYKGVSADFTDKHT
jgi:hypothetical protein